MTFLVLLILFILVISLFSKISNLKQELCDRIKKLEHEVNVVRHNISERKHYEQRMEDVVKAKEGKKESISAINVNEEIKKTAIDEIPLKETSKSNLSLWTCKFCKVSTVTYTSYCRICKKHRNLCELKEVIVSDVRPEDMRLCAEDIEKISEQFTNKEKSKEPENLPVKENDLDSGTPVVKMQVIAKQPEMVLKKETIYHESVETISKENQWHEKWNQFIKNVDWEQFTGTKLFAWLGGVALFLAAGFFVKYSIDKNLIPPVVRLVIGAFMGLSLIIWSDRFERGKYDIMRHTLAAGGLGVLYTVVFAATLYYQYLNAIVGFSCLCVVSAAAFVIAIYYQGISISVLGAIGAYLTPILVDTGYSNLSLLFTYLAIVNLGFFQVMRKLKSLPLLLVATAGTLISLGFETFTANPPDSSIMISCVWIANLFLFSASFDRLKVNPENSRLVLWSGICLYLSTLFVALILTIGKTSGGAPLLLVTGSIAGAVMLALNNKGWYARVIFYSVLTFFVAVIWALLKFNTSGPWSFLLFFLYGVMGGLGPILLIKKYGANKTYLDWFKIFPVCLGGLILIAVLKDPRLSFWFWPMSIGIQILGIGVSLLFGGIIQLGLLVLFLSVGGIFWITHIPAGFMHFGFYSFILVAGTGICLTSFFILYKMPSWIQSLGIKQDVTEVSKVSPLLTQWMMATPAMGVFLLLSSAFITNKLISPNLGMTTIFCFLILTLTLSKRFSFQHIGVITLVSSVFAQATCILKLNLSLAYHFSSLIWSSIFFICSLLIPFIFFSSYEKHNKLWMAWAFFELFQGICIIFAADHLWIRDISGWIPMILVISKLPIVTRLIRQLKGKEQRNSILAWHGGVLLFYASAIPIMLLDNGWMGLTFVFEATALLWLNRRIEHSGLRLVSVILAPIGLYLLWLSLPQMKNTESLMILNPAILSVAASIVALFSAVSLAPFPTQMLKKINISNYFKWISLGVSFYFINLVIADVFAASYEPLKLTFKFMPRGNLLQSICYCLSWTLFGAILWRNRTITERMRVVGIMLLFLSVGWLILFPFMQAGGSVAQMKPWLNLGQLAYLPMMAILFVLFLKEPWGESSASIKNVFLALFLIIGFIWFKMEKSTILQPGQNFSLLHSHNLSMGVTSIASWIVFGLGLFFYPKRLDRPFRIAGVTLIVIGVLKAALLPFRFKIAFGMMTPLLNAPTFLYVFCLIVLIFLTIRKQAHWPFLQINSHAFWGIICALLAFYILNIEIASIFGIKGRSFSLLTHGSLAHQLGYSLGWMVYSIVLLIVGIKWNIVKVRWTALILLVFTAFKIFLKDLWSLGQLYRVASFVGLAAVLMLVSFIYQRYLSKEEKNNE